MPEALTVASAGFRTAWIFGRFAVPSSSCRSLRSCIPRIPAAALVSADFERVSFAHAGCAALVSSVMFGLGHGSMSVPAIAAGLAYGGLAMRTRRFGEAVIAHATTNFLLALIVLIFGQWQLW